MSANKPASRPRPAAHRAHGGAHSGSVASPSAKTMEGAIVRALTMVGASFQAPRDVASDIVRFRPRGAVDRRVRVEYITDPEHSESVLLRLTPASAADLRTAPIDEDLLSSQQAADLLNVSRPYLTKLADKDTFRDVVRTAAGHRRIPRAEVERVRAEMRDTRRAARAGMEAVTKDLRTRELEAARAKPKRRWAPKAT